MLMLVLGIFLGKEVFSTSGEIPVFSNQLNSVLDQIEYLYVDTVDRRSLEEAAVEAIVNELDPHSVYFDAEEVQAMAEPMEGGFEGIGVEFLITNDTLMVVTALPGGPSEGVGIRAGDRILRVDTTEISGPELSNSMVMNLLKGKGGTLVNLGLMRGGTGELYDVVITRARIPIRSVVASFILEEKVGYVKIIRFAATTSYEFAVAMDDLVAQGADKVVVDLRGNGGGYLKSCTDMIDLFLQKGCDIVYTEGKSSPKLVYQSEYDGVFSDMPIAILIDESSASASEIFAGAIQDNDRGVILGRRSFGKGLVQEEYNLSIDGALRLTVARFYTPSGRAIQKPYGEGVDYAQDHDIRAQSGELFYADSIRHLDSLAHKTVLGRTVYGGGGITPDVFIPLDTTESSRDLAELIWSGKLRDGAFKWVDRNRDALDGMSSYVELGSSSLWNHPVYGGLAEIERAYNELMGYEPNWDGDEKERILKRFLAQVARNVLDEQEYYKVMAEGDEFLERALYELLVADRFHVKDGRLYLFPAEADTIISQSFNLSPNGF